jgi:hypothetical protein
MKPVFGFECFIALLVCCFVLPTTYLLPVKNPNMVRIVCMDAAASRSPAATDPASAHFLGLYSIMSVA